MLLRRYYRIRKGGETHPRGLVSVCVQPSGAARIGYSLCDDVDIFTYKRANEIVTGRLELAHEFDISNVPGTLRAIRSLPYSLRSVGVEVIEKSSYLLSQGKIQK